MKTQFTVISRRGFVAVAVASLGYAGLAFAADPAPEGKADAKKGTSAPLESQDKDFMMEAAKGGMMEVEMGKMAEQKGQSAEVKKVGKMMVTDHSKANNQLMGLAKQKGVTLETSHKAEKISDSNFDQAYLDQMVKDHEKDIAAFEKEAKNGKDAEVKGWAGKTLPTLKRHLQMVKDAQGKMTKKTS